MSTFVCPGQCLLRRLCESRRGWSSHTQVRCAVSVTSSHHVLAGCLLTYPGENMRLLSREGLKQQGQLYGWGAEFDSNFR